MLYVVPSLALTVVMTSDPTEPSRQDGYRDRLHALLADGIIPAVEPDSEALTNSGGIDRTDAGASQTPALPSEN
jgi:hypothetical protein